MNTSVPTCLVCKQDDTQAPLLSFSFQGVQHFICPQHLPILIHKPAQLADQPPGLEKIKAVEGHH